MDSFFNDFRNQWQDGPIIITRKNSEILKPMWMKHLKHVLENGNIFTHQTLAKVCKILPLNAEKIVSGLKKNINHSYFFGKKH